MYKKFIVLALMVIPLAGCWNDEEAFRQKFAASCIADGIGDEEKCKCVYSQIRVRMPSDIWRGIVDAANNDESPKIFLASMAPDKQERFNHLVYVAGQRCRPDLN